MLIYAIDDEPAMLAELHDAIAAAVEAGLVQGTFVDGKLLLRPKAQISRLEALVLLARFLPEPSVPGEAVAGAPAWAAKELARLEAAGFASALHDLEYAGGTPLAKEQLTSYCEMLASAYAASGSLSHPGYTLEKVVVLSRHNIRSPLSGRESFGRGGPAGAALQSMDRGRHHPAG